MVGILMVIGAAAIWFVIIFGIRRLAGKGKAGKQRSVNRPGPAQTPSGPSQALPTAVISCPNCGAKLRVPCGKGALDVSCPNCRNSFRYESGAAPTPPQRTNELDAYRKGGAQRMEMWKAPNTLREARIALIASWSCGYIDTILFDRDGSFWEFLQEYNASVDYLTVQYAATEVVFDVYVRNAPQNKINFTYTYNEVVEDKTAAVIRLEPEELTVIRRMALSCLADQCSAAVMENGRIFESRR